MSAEVRPLSADAVTALEAHLKRHRAESGIGDHHFMPFAPDDPEGPRGLDVASFERPLTDPGWQRWFIATIPERVVGHVSLKGDLLRTGLHRCELGIGIEREHRGSGLGRELMTTAISFARGVDTLFWVDLRVFGHNALARALYRSLGFTEIGTVVDRFRIDGEAIDDVIMALSVR